MPFIPGLARIAVRICSRYRGKSAILGIVGEVADAVALGIDAEEAAADGIATGAVGCLAVALGIAAEEVAADGIATGAVDGLTVHRPSRKT